MKARDFARGLKLESRKEWVKFCTDVGVPHDIPKYPEEQYLHNGWIDWFDFLGTIPGGREFLSFNEAGEYVRDLGLKNESEWRKYKKNDGFPQDIPRTPESVYRGEWISMPDWLGTKPGYKKTVFIDFLEAKKICRDEGIKTMSEWTRFCRESKRFDIPAKPDRKFKDTGWNGWSDFLGKNEGEK